MASENENEKRETLADLLAEMRREVGDGEDTYCGKRIIRRMDDVRVRQYCDRIEAAWKRDEERAVEHATRHAEAVARDNCRDCVHNPKGKNYEGGNAAAMREALVEMVNADTDGDMTLDSLCGRCIDKLHGTCKHDGSCWCEKVIAALSAPARNCDRFWSIEQARTAYLAECGRVISIWDGAESWLFESWLLAPAAERKGDSK